MDGYDVNFTPLHGWMRCRPPCMAWPRLSHALPHTVMSTDWIIPYSIPSAEGRARTVMQHSCSAEGQVTLP